MKMDFEHNGKSKCAACKKNKTINAALLLLQKDSKHGFAEKVRWGKNLNSCVGLRVGSFCFLSRSVKLH
jgi:hypothetical protein